jgi:hypothetical protein
MFFFFPKQKMYIVLAPLRPSAAVDGEHAGAIVKHNSISIICVKKLESTVNRCKLICYRGERKSKVCWIVHELFFLLHKGINSLIARFYIWREMKRGRMN